MESPYRVWREPLKLISYVFTQFLHVRFLELSLLFLIKFIHTLNLCRTQTTTKPRSRSRQFRMSAKSLKKKRKGCLAVVEEINKSKKKLLLIWTQNSLTKRCLTSQDQSQSLQPESPRSILPTLLKIMFRGKTSHKVYKWAEGMMNSWIDGLSQGPLFVLTEIAKLSQPSAK